MIFLSAQAELNFNCANMPAGDIFKMMTRQLLSVGMLILLPTLACAINDTPQEKPAEQTTPSEYTPAKPTPVITLPASIETNIVDNAASATPAPAKPITTLPPAQKLPAKPVPAAPLKPVAPQTAPAKPAPMHSPAIAKSAPAIAIPLKPAPAVAIPAPVKPVATPSKHLPPANAETVTTGKDETIDIEFFVREGCAQCGIAHEFLTKLKKLQPDLKISIRDVRKEPAALELLKRMAQNHGDAAMDYPAFVVGGQLIIGFTDEANSAQHILDILAITHPPRDQSNEDTENCITGKDLSCGLIKVTPTPQEEEMAFSIFGYDISLLQIGLPLFTIAMGLLDGLNHGSTWVLILIISLLSPMKNRPLMIAIAGTFILVQSIFYFMLVSIWLNLNLLIGTSRITGIIFAGIAFIAGTIYLVKYIYFGERLTLSSPEIAKPGTYTRIRKIVETEGLLPILASTAVLAIVVQMGEFAFTSAFPLLYTKVLSLQHFSTLSNYSYLLLYDFSYMLDDVIVLTIGVITLSQSRPEANEGRTIKLISGLLLMALTSYILLA